MYSGGILSISEVNALCSEQFEWLFGNVIEHYPDATQHIAFMRPFPSVKNLKMCFYEYLENLDVSEKENVLLRYPDLSEKLNENELINAGSEFEQEYAELHTMSKEEKQLFATYNNLYKEKFRFPFVICMYKNNVQTILASIQTRLRSTRENELQIGIQEVKKICSNRIDDLVWSDA
ncbi:2-oxo-4-hydroxy-4-carboxy-5-ureidoimidazoline decarboxylase-like [Calliopsis andreniformis]|uniref:2-oxo-4-hydroxy-4-carboxy-5-ureidoimidazoline decarboxylase-like n=1 Tax=Calliopsis andreniformis TaxID=337506 RepID=UPI003FCD5584